MGDEDYKQKEREYNNAQYSQMMIVFGLAIFFACACIGFAFFGGGG